MKINIPEFKEVIKKVTLNNSISALHLKFENGQIKSSMISQQKDIITQINIPNTMIDLPTTDVIEFHFSEPLRVLDPALKIWDEEAEIKIVDGDKPHIHVISSVSESFINFCKPVSILRNIFLKSAKDEYPSFKTIAFDDDMQERIEKIKTVAPNFGKAYVVVKDGRFTLEITDLTNEFSSRHIFPFGEAEAGQADVQICYDYKNILSLLAVINDTFVLKFAYLEKADGGFIHAINGDESEQYYLFNREL
jgi:hypothetical protein